MHCLPQAAILADLPTLDSPSKLEAVGLPDSYWPFSFSFPLFSSRNSLNSCDLSNSQIHCS